MKVIMQHFNFSGSVETCPPNTSATSKRQSIL